MTFFSFILKKNKQKIENKKNHNNFIDKYKEIGKIVKEGRIQKNISVQELSSLSKIPENTIHSIENNIENIRPKYPFIRSILYKLEECLSLKKNILVGLLVKETKKVEKKGNKEFVLSKFDFINTWVGTVFYFLILILIIFVLKRYFFSNESIIEVQKIEEKINAK